MHFGFIMLRSRVFSILQQQRVGGCHGRSLLAGQNNTALSPPAASGRRFISSSELTIDLKGDKSDFEKRPKKENLIFGTTLSDHMLVVEWGTKNGWSSPK